MKFLQILLLTSTLVATLWLAWQLLDLWRMRKRKRRRRMPDAWPLSRRPVLNARERHVYALMKQAFPQYDILIKLPLTRFMQLRDLSNALFWYELLTPLSVSFTLCDGNTQVFAVLDLLNEERSSSSATRLKQRALLAAQIRYVELDATTVPTVRQLRDLMLSDKEQRDSLWRTSSSHPRSKSPATGGQRSTQQEADFENSRLQLHRQVQSQRENRRAFTDSRAHEQGPPSREPRAYPPRQESKPYQDRRALKGNKPEARPSRFNPDTIRDRDSFLTPDSRGHENYRFVEGAVMPYTTKDNVAAEHIWLDSKASSREDGVGETIH